MNHLYTANRKDRQGVTVSLKSVKALESVNPLFYTVWFTEHFRYNTESYSFT